MDSQKVWTKALEEIKATLGPANFRAWFSQTSVGEIEDSKITLIVPSAFIESQLKARYFELINSAIENVYGQKLELIFKIDSSKLEKKVTASEDLDDIFTVAAAPTTAGLNPKFTLDNFVVGPSNNLAFAAAQAVVANPGISYNPLFLYGGTGVGKTHLMIAIGNALLAKNPKAKVIYCSSEKFMNDYITAIQNHKMGDLRARYRSTSILMIDDTQFFSGREGTQEEFFHTFNELQANNSQIILTSDKAPNEIEKLEDRLKSRFQGGLIVDIQQPDFDTRVAILRAKCLERGEIMPEESLKLMASSFESNIRELEGKLIQILQAMKIQNISPTPDNIASYLNKPTQRTTITDPKKVISTICSHFDLNLKDLTGPKRQKELVLPRHLAMYILSEEIHLTVEKIGQILGGRDHTTVMHGRDRIKDLLKNDREVQRVMIEVKGKLST
jgi:chromosomal replication initiator protein